MLLSKVLKELYEMLPREFIGGISDQAKELRVLLAVPWEAGVGGGLKFTRVIELRKSAWVAIGQHSCLEASSGAMITAASASPDEMDEVITLLQGSQGSVSRGTHEYSAGSNGNIM